ncbi:MAG: aminoacetone oxidase family FAD-binding enzyme [Lachnospiraceae bacterium]|nr:aminoacetone oxidase family FAD-binding enzyme [Lachnospiraceae bacterium]
MKKVGIIGGGASGLTAALYAHRNGASVTVFERKDRVGKKILVTGNGRCNFTNEYMKPECYYTDDTDFVGKVLSEYSKDDLCLFFMGLGLLIKEKNGYYYPACEQASAVLDVIRNALDETDVEIKTESLVTEVKKNKSGFSVKTESGETFSFDKIIIATGGKAGIGTKEQANGYDLLKSLGHKIGKLYPALTQMKCEGLNFKGLAGVRSDCEMYVFSDENLIMQQAGEVLFTDNGLSGIVSFQVSHCVAELLDNKKDVNILMNLLPGFDEESLKNFVISKILLHENSTVENFFTGFLNKKLNVEIIKRNGLKPSARVCDYDRDTIINAVLSMQEILVKAVGVNGFDKAQVTGGGVPTAELSDTLESKICEGLYITGELMDVDGICGGYNLQWAFSTGAIAGKNAATK